MFWNKGVKKISVDPLSCWGLIILKWKRTKILLPSSYFLLDKCYFILIVCNVCYTKVSGIYVALEIYFFTGILSQGIRFHFSCLSYQAGFKKGENSSLAFYVQTPQNGQTHLNNLSAKCRRIVWECLTILWGWRLKG